jgi:electron transfer flavoprotein alpha subunit
MSVLIFAETSEGRFKKISFEATSYAAKIAEMLQTNLVALSINASEPNQLSDYGATKILNVKNAQLDNFNAKAYADAIKQAADAESATVVVIDSSSNGLFLAPLAAYNLKAGFGSNTVALPVSVAPFVVKRTAFSNKAFCLTELTTSVKVIGLAKNAFGVFENKVEATVEAFNPSLNDADFNIVSKEINKTSGKVSIADADIVVSGGRGLKGPENWGMLEELAEVLGAATACSKPVADLDWRPHNEHVGQTGKPVAANLYIAIGISGAIQHLAGINASKVKVVINTDPEAPFFKAADYGIVGDAFEVVPQLVEKLKAFKQNNA